MNLNDRTSIQGLWLVRNGQLITLTLAPEPLHVLLNRVSAAQFQGVFVRDVVEPTMFFGVPLPSGPSIGGDSVAIWCHEYRGDAQSCATQFLMEILERNHNG